MINYNSFADEISKIAAARWKRVLRAGGLDTGDKGRLLRSGVLDFGKEISGLERGTEELAKKRGFTIRRAGGKELKEGVRGLIKEKDPKKLLETAQTGLVAARGGGYAAMPAASTAYVSPRFSPLRAGKGNEEAQRALEALATRHEIDELITGQEALRGGATRIFVPGRAPKGLREKMTVKSLDAQRKLLDLAEKKVPDMLPPESQEEARTIMEAVGQVGRGVLPVKPGVLPAGRHMSPEVILRESKNVATLPAGTADAMRAFREGEMQTMGPLGFQYGQESPAGTRRQILKAFGRGEI